MSTSFPGGLDSFTNPQSTDKVSIVDHAAQHANANDSITALEAKVGANSSAVTSTLDYKLSGVTGTDKAVSKTGAETLTNKTLTSPTVNSPTVTSPTVSNPTTTGTDTGIEALQNKTITDPTNNVTAKALRSATTDVSTAAATAPTNGQVLTATGPNAATWQSPSASPDYSVLAYNSASQPINQNSFGVIPFDSERFDTDAMHDPVTNNSRITFNHAGKYSFNASMYFPATPYGDVALQVRLNGSTVIAYGGGETGNGSGIGGASSASGIYSFAVNDYIELLAGSPASGNNAASGYSFSAFKFA